MIPAPSRVLTPLAMAALTAVTDGARGEATLRAFTLDAAYAAHQEEVIGSLEAGKWADFILIDRDPFKNPPADLWKVKVEQTWVGGERVH